MLRIAAVGDVVQLHCAPLHGVAFRKGLLARRRGGHGATEKQARTTILFSPLASPWFRSLPILRAKPLRAATDRAPTNSSSGQERQPVRVRSDLMAADPLQR